jgi:hypothetical protein
VGIVWVLQIVLMRSRLLCGGAGHCEPEARKEDELPVDLCKVVLSAMALEARAREEVEPLNFEKYRGCLSLSPHLVIKKKTLPTRSDSTVSLLLSLQKY